jgi:multiple sugar transport system substrate-binding protein
MKKSSKLLVVLACLLVFMITFSGCGASADKPVQPQDNNSTSANVQTSSSDNDSQVTTQGSETVTLDFAFWGTGDEVEFKKRLTKEFEEAYPNIKINGTYTDGLSYPQKLQTLLSANMAPDLISIAGDIMYDFVTKDVFEDLTPYMEADNLLTGVWSDSIIDVLTYKDKIIAAPFDYKIPAIIYNKDLFDKAGIPYPDSNWTEDQLLEYAQKITSGSGANKIWGIYLNSWLQTTVIRNLYGTPFYDNENLTMNAENNEQFKHALGFFTDLIAKYEVAPNDSASQSFGSAIGGFETGKYGMAITAPWEIGNFQKLIGDKFKWDIVRLPKNQTYGPWKGILFSDGIGMSVTSDNKNEAWQYIKYLTTDDKIQLETQEIGIPATLKVAGSDEFLNNYPQDWKPYNKKVFIDMLDVAVGWDSTGIWAKINDELTKKYQEIVQGKTTVDEACKYLQEKGTEILNNK